MKPTCPRSFAAEALRDGRLTGAEVARFQAHVSVCPTCAREVQAMEALAQALRSPSNSHDADELHVRRERTRLLAAFNARLVPAPQSPLAMLRLPAAAALVVLVGLALVLSRPRAVAPVTTSQDPVKVSAASASKWTRRSKDQLETLTLESGTLSIRVDHELPHRRLLVVLPDGELEDIGTTFSVTAAAAHTTHVSVQDGSVVLRLNQQPALTLRAGDTWTPAATPEPAATPAPSQPAPAPILRSAKPTASATPTPAASARTPASDASADFRTALSALTSGDNGRASDLFAGFLLRHPRDSHSEDAAYLRVLALQRSGHSDGVKQAASEYLSRYPHGFRRAEIEPLSR